MSSFAQEVNEFEYDTGDTTYIMKKYYMCFLMKGEVSSQTEQEAAEFQAKHLDYIQKLADEGKVLISGPFENGDEYRGILIFDADSKELAEEWVSDDPLVSSGRLTYRIIPWWAAKGSTLK
jgi:uncharacterized protein YciI